MKQGENRLRLAPPEVYQTHMDTSRSVNLENRGEFAEQPGTKGESRTLRG